jgi:hypothetical protein
MHGTKWKKSVNSAVGEGILLSWNRKSGIPAPFKDTYKLSGENTSSNPEASLSPFMKFQSLFCQPSLPGEFIIITHLSDSAYDSKNEPLD